MEHQPSSDLKGLVGLCKADQTFPEFWNFHCIIHREQLVSKSLNLNNVMKPVMEIINYMRLTTGNSRISSLSWTMGFQMTCRCTALVAVKRPGTLSLL